MLQKPLSHAYIIVGHPDRTREALLAHLEHDHGVSVRGNPDVTVHAVRRLYGDDAIALIDRVSVRSDTKYIIISAVDATIDAQNKLLKTIEEPSAGSHLFLIVPSIHIILPTIRSRAQIIIADDTDGALATATTFLKLPINARMKHIEKMLSEIKDDDQSKMNVVELIDGCTAAVHATEPRNYTLLKQLLDMRSFAFDQSASLKYVLEWIALALPIPPR